MKNSGIKICILRIEGTNCEDEMYHSFERLGAKPEIVHLKQLIKNKNLFDYQCLMIPGGFSTGDYVRAGAIFAALIKSRLRNDIKKFVEEGYPVGGICNGFQVLVELGLLPGFDKKMNIEAVLTINDSNRFECRPTLLRHENNGNSVFTKKIQKNRVFMIPSAHAEGKFLFPKGEEEKYLKKLIDNDQIVFRYVNEDGEYAGYPWNPNGSFYNIAGICNPEGNVFGMMPHPERVFYRYQHPDWTRTNLKNLDGDGKIVFESVLEYIRKRF
ncbi:MAG: phosphoribosylformylglycinamidine synthase subunit PurQ [Candidatus Thermoplasmatota archaeon]|nr:phosphoribosylformylglycinamidine synthase subunit PurQ [Candidatus Thermoplasmatota archaeon]